jgi:peptidoglycan/LPS O-acetylase OafA/YrhL
MSPDLKKASEAPAHPPVRRIHELDGLRGMLALFVVCYHMYGPLAILRTTFAEKFPLLLQGWYPVDVFFLMSGFVMMHVYQRAFSGTLHWAAFWQFMRARVARLYPVHVAAMFLMLLCMLPAIYKSPDLYQWGGRYSLGAFVGSLAMLHGPWIDYRSWNYPAWSISAEWHAYLLFPLLVPLALRCRGVVAGLMLVASAVVPFTLYLQQLSPDPFPTNGWPVLMRVFPLFFGGMLLYRVAPVRWFSSGTAALLFVGGTLVVLFFDKFSALAVLLAPPMIMAALSENWFQSLLRRPTLLFLGKISYSLYMTHALVETFFVTLLQRVGMRFFNYDLGAHLGPSFLVWSAGIGVALVLGYCTWRWVEEHARQWVMRVTTRSRGVVPVRSS